MTATNRVLRSLVGEERITKSRFVGQTILWLVASGIQFGLFAGTHGWAKWVSLAVAIAFAAMVLGLVVDVLLRGFRPLSES